MNTDREHSEQQTKQSRWGFRGMTVRNWLELLIVPLVLVGIGLLFEMQQASRQQATEKQQQALAEQRAQDEALQAYLNQMSGLLLERDLRASEKGTEVRTLARARTLTVLGTLDPSGKTALMQFLVEADLVQRVDRRDPIISLRGANLSGADLEGANLSNALLVSANLTRAILWDANLSGADLSSEADLSNADLSGADLGNANLSRAYLRQADLSEANLDNANLSGTMLLKADLSEANLGNANLSRAYLRRADLSGTNLRDADLREAVGVTNEQLSAARLLEGATMPDGQTLKSDANPDGPTFEDWLKDKKVRERDEENEENE